jgi:ParB family transcriptional regulator, chromosome partitioning protein
MARPHNRLGKGLDALITPRTNLVSSPLETAPGRAATGALRQIPLDQIVPNPHQPRATFDEATLGDLAASIRADGIVQPIIVRATGDHTFQLVAGERRWRAAKLAGLATVPGIVRELSDAQAFHTALIENLQREDLAPLERAAAYQHYLDSYGGTIEELATTLAESRANVSNYLRLLKLRTEICYMLGAGELGMGQARAIAGIPDQQKQLAIARLAARRNLSVRQVEELARRADATPANQEPEAQRTPLNASRQHLSSVEQALGKAIGLRVRVRAGRKKNSGRVVISYANIEEFDRIAERIGGSANLE